MVLGGLEIQRRILVGDIICEPFNEAHINPHSIDVTLSFENSYIYDVNKAIKRGIIFDFAAFSDNFKVFASPIVGSVLEDKISRFIVLHPHELLIACTQEKIGSEKFKAQLEGKSSIARGFVKIHEAGYIDVGFVGAITLEIETRLPVVLREGMRIGQVDFTPIIGDFELYKGKYSDSPTGAQLTRGSFK